MNQSLVLLNKLLQFAALFMELRQAGVNIGRLVSNMLKRRETEPYGVADLSEDLVDAQSAVDEAREAKPATG